ncbi:MAG TPA: chalcone isomerase family protein [Ramlibacter sp.]|nr:chalcone isomerase family protein [Ramlibacter sp.]
MLAAAISLFACASFAQMQTVSGVKYDENIDLRGAKLHLNGAGVRYKFVVKVYTAGLYLPKKAATADDVLAMPGPKKMSVTMLRDIDSNELGKLFIRGVEDNMDNKASFTKLIPGLMRMSQLFTEVKQLKAGDTFTIEWVPGTGTIITVRGKQEGEPFKEAEFYNALLRIWLGPQPADWKLKDALLGKPAA